VRRLPRGNLQKVFRHRDGSYERPGTFGPPQGKFRSCRVLPRILQNHFFRAMSLGRQGRLGEALDLLLETRRLAELTGERVQLTRLPNTIAWIHRESLDLEGALELNLGSIPITVELGDTESEINSRINTGQVYLLLGESTHAFEQLDLARRLLESFQWFRWLFQVRLECELASYWIGRGDLKQARSHASAALEITGTSLTRKHMAWARKLLGDIPVLEERVDEARREYDKSLRIVEEYPCPPVEWRIRKARAEFARQIGNDAGSSEDIARSQQIVDSLSASIRDGHLRQIFLSSRAVVDLRNVAHRASDQ
jgi:tetratricopeptide (TPR) repeat protein